MAGARHFSELAVWQLADELRRATFALTERDAYRRDFKLCSHTEDSANSACRNIAEGFGCETHREFARFLRIARRSLNELQDAFIAAVTKRYVTEQDLDNPRRLLRRIFAAMSRFLAYLDQTPEHRHRPKGEPLEEKPSKDARPSSPPQPTAPHDDTPTDESAKNRHVQGDNLEPPDPPRHKDDPAG